MEYAIVPESEGLRQKKKDLAGFIAPGLAQLLHLLLQRQALFF
jgi:hypothetical protein